MFNNSTLTPSPCPSAADFSIFKLCVPLNSSPARVVTAGAEITLGEPARPSTGVAEAPSSYLIQSVAPVSKSLFST
jgi:hypothetical protein